VRNTVAAAGLDALHDAADALVVVASDRVAQVVERKTTLDEAFRIAADVLRQGAQAIAGPLARPGAVALDLAGARAVMSGGGEALMGIGAGPLVDAARQAAGSPLLDGSLADARTVLVSIAAGGDVTRSECEAAVEVVRSAAGPGPRIAAGAARDEQLGAEARVTVIATRGRAPGRPPRSVEAPPVPRPWGLGDMVVLARPRRKS
jgi:cell division protein FtsZ